MKGANIEKIFSHDFHVSYWSESFVLSAINVSIMLIIN